MSMKGTLKNRYLSQNEKHEIIKHPFPVESIMGQLGFGNIEQRYATLEQKKELLVQLDQLVPWQQFEQLLNQAHDKLRKSSAGRKPMAVMLMFKLLILQKSYNISDERLEYQVNDRLSLMRFLDLDIYNKVLDAMTVWLFREQMREQGLIEQFERYLRTHGYAAKSGQIIDATLIPVPKQCNSREENEQIKRGEQPATWADKLQQQAQKDTDPDRRRSMASEFRLQRPHQHRCGVRLYPMLCHHRAITDASVHDSQMLGKILDGDHPDDGECGDSAYRSDAAEAALRLLKFESHIHERAYCNHPLGDQQKDKNRERSTIHSRIEHLFGRWVMTMGDKRLRSIGLEHAKTHLRLTNLTSNLKRFVFWQVKSVSMAE